MKQFNPIKLRVVAEIEPMDILQELSYEEAEDFICAVDLAFADVGFTENVIKKLIKSMKDDLSEEEWKPYAELLNNIS